MKVGGHKGHSLSFISPNNSRYLKLATDKGVPIHTPSLPRYSFFWPSMMNCTLSTVGKDAAV